MGGDEDDMGSDEAELGVIHKANDHLVSFARVDRMTFQLRALRFTERMNADPI